MTIFWQNILFLILLFPLLAGAQSAEVDSLLLLLPKLSADTNKVKTLNRLSTKIRAIDAPKSFNFAEEALELSEQLGYEKGQMDAYYFLGAASVKLNKIEEAIRYGGLSKQLGEKLQTPGELSRANNLLGTAYAQIGDREQATSYTLKAGEIAEKAGDNRRSAFAYITLGNLWYEQNLDQARKYYQIALDKAQALNSKPLLSMICKNLGNIALLEEQHAKAIEYLECAKEAALAVGNYSLLNHCDSDLAVLYISTGRFEDALTVLRSVLKNVNSGDAKTVNSIYVNLGKAFHGLAQIDSSIFYYQRSQVLSTELDLINPLISSHRNLANLYESKGEYALAIEHNKQYVILKDSLFNGMVDTKLADATTRYETAKKESQITLQQLEIAQQKNQQNKIIVGSILLLALMAGIFQYFVYRQRREKQEAELALKIELAEAERLRQLNEMKTQFFTNVSHELRTPLTLIMSPLEESLKKLKQVNLEPNLQLAYRNSRHLHQLMNEVLDLAKLEAGELESKQEKIILVPLLRRILYSFQSVADQKKVKLTFASSLAEELSLYTDISKFEKILNNLISNAVKFTPEEGEITLSAQLSNAGDSIELVVEDSGQGIAAADLPHIFNRFYQGKAGQDHPQGGTGIGLSLSKQLAERLGGQLTVESEEQKGSRFKFQLPLTLVEKESLIHPGQSTEVETIASSEQSEDQQSSNLEPLLIKGHRPRLLIVEDNPEMSTYLKTSLSEHYDCVLAKDGEAALKKLEEHRFDLITSDVMMPNMNGFELREKINEQEHWRQIPFILLTARTLEADKLKGLQLGVDDYITKPFSLPELEARIHNLLQNKISRDEWGEEETETTNTDEVLILNAEKLVLERLNDSTFSVIIMAQQLGYSSRNLSRVLGKLTGLSPVKFVLEIRLQKARQLLESQKYLSVAEVRYEVGIESASYFTKKFTERFGKNPKDFL